MKKRRQALPLLNSIEPDVYLVDTSAWSKIDSRPDAEAVWRLVSDLIKCGRVYACSQVMAELRGNAFYRKRIKPHEKSLQFGDLNSDDPAYLQHVGRITHDHPGMSKATSWKTRADPYVVALAELQGYVVVAEENTNKRPNTKIPGVCKKRRIRCLTLDGFVCEATASIKAAK